MKGGLTILLSPPEEEASLADRHPIARTPAKRLILEASGSKVCLLNFDNDSRPDLFVINHCKNHLFHRRGPPPHDSQDGTSTDSTKKPT